MSDEQARCVSCRKLRNPKNMATERMCRFCILAELSSVMGPVR